MKKLTKGQLDHIKRKERAARIKQEMADGITHKCSKCNKDAEIVYDYRPLCMEHKMELTKKHTARRPKYKDLTQEQKERKKAITNKCRLKRQNKNAQLLESGEGKCKVCGRKAHHLFETKLLCKKHYRERRNYIETTTKERTLNWREQKKALDPKTQSCSTCGKKSKVRIGYAFYCKEHAEAKRVENRKSAKKHQKKRTPRAIKAAELYFDMYYDKTFKKLKLKNKKKVAEMIKNYYNTNVLSEPHFCILLHDILKLQGGDPIREMPYLIGDEISELVPKFADLYDRKFNIVIETKAAWRGTNAQYYLDNQKIYMKKAFPKASVYAVSPDNKQKNLVGLFRFLSLLSRKISK